MYRSSTTRFAGTFAGLALAAAGMTLAGCEQEVAEVETPQGEVEVEENMDGTTEVESD
jgi:hypothetical protein